MPSSRSTRAPNPSIVIGITIRRRWHNWSSGGTHNRGAVPDHFDGHCPCLAIERSRAMECARWTGSESNRGVIADLKAHSRRTREECGKKYLVLNNLVWVCVRLIWSIACCTIVGTRGGRGESIPEMNLVSSHSGWLAGFVCCNIVGKEVPPVFMRHIVNILMGAWRDSWINDGTNVMGLAVIVPANNLFMRLLEHSKPHGWNCLTTSTKLGWIARTCCQRLCHISSPLQSQFLSGGRFV